MLFNSIIILVLLANTLFSVAIFLRNPSAPVNKRYVSFVTFLDIWIVTNFLENEPGIVGFNNLDLFLRLDFAFATFFFYEWFRFCAVLVQSKILLPRFRWVRLGLTSLAIAFAFLSLFGPGIITDISFYDGVIHFADGFLLLPYGAFILFCSVGGLVLLFLGARRAGRAQRTRERQQIYLTFTGFLLALGIATVINLFLQPFFPISLEVSRIGLYGMSFLVLFTGYAIVIRRMFDVRLIIARAVSYFLLVILLAAIYTAALFLLVGVFLGFTVNLKVIGISVVLTALTALTFQRLHDMVSQVTDRFFFKGRYDSSKLLSGLTKIMVEEVDLDRLTGSILKTLVNEMRITRAAFLMVKSHVITSVKGVGYEGSDFMLSSLESLFYHHPAPTTTFNFEEMTEGPTKELFRKLDIMVAIPIKTEQGEVAILILGTKQTGESYYERDLSVLQIFAGEAGIAIQNAQAYAAIKEFNTQLERRVEERTRELKDTQERELAKARDLARLKDEFVFIATHELRTPVAAIRGFLELMTESQKKLPAKAKEDLKAIGTASDQLKQLIDDLLEIARSETNATKIMLKPVDLVPIINEVRDELAPLARQNRVTLEVKVHGVIPKVMADEQKAREIVMNLVSNGIKYNRLGGWVDIIVSNLPDNVLVEVRDTGYGIPAAMKGKIFEKFFRARAAGTEKVTGTGLGLFIVRMLAEKMGGKVGFTSTEGEGSTFSFTLPVASG